MSHRGNLEFLQDGAAYLLSSKAGAEAGSGATALGSYAFEQFRADPPLHLKALLRLLGIANAKQRKALCFACDL